MKKILLLIVLLLLPLSVRAEENKLNIYLFRGEGCPHCEDALEWFDSLDDTTKNKFNLIQYEVWHNNDNHELMKNVANTMGDSTEGIGVPYIVMGDQSFIGFSTSSPKVFLSIINKGNNNYDVMKVLNNETIEMDDSNKNAEIKEQYNNEVKNDNMNNSNDLVFNIISVILIIIMFICIYIFVFFNK